MVTNVSFCEYNFCSCPNSSDRGCFQSSLMSFFVDTFYYSPSFANEGMFCTDVFGCTLWGLNMVFPAVSFLNREVQFLPSFSIVMFKLRNVMLLATEYIKERLLSSSSRNWHSKTFPETSPNHEDIIDVSVPTPPQLRVTIQWGKRTTHCNILNLVLYCITLYLHRYNLPCFINKMLSVLQ